MSGVIDIGVWIADGWEIYPVFDVHQECNVAPKSLFNSHLHKTHRRNPFVPFVLARSIASRNSLRPMSITGIHNSRPHLPFPSRPLPIRESTPLHKSSLFLLNVLGPDVLPLSLQRPTSVSSGVPHIWDLWALLYVRPCSSCRTTCRCTCRRPYNPQFSMQFCALGPLETQPEGEREPHISNANADTKIVPTKT